MAASRIGISKGNYYIMSDKQTTTCSGGGACSGSDRGLPVHSEDVLELIPCSDGLFWNGSTPREAATPGATAKPEQRLIWSTLHWSNGSTWSNGYYLEQRGNMGCRRCRPA